jgi:anti-sigma regulatory factor (Ser/Thr protein kinase)
MTAAIGPMPASYEHVALLHRGADELGERLAPQIGAALANREAVLVTLEKTEWHALADHLGRQADQVTYIESGSRYATPGSAMASVHRFATSALATGSPAVWSIGSIPFEGNGDDARWVRYETAVDDILGALPCRLVCAYDAARVGDHLVAAACRGHSHIISNGQRHRSPDFSPHERIAASIATPPREQVVIDAVVDQPIAVRRMLTAAFGAEAGSDALADVHVAASELVTNGLRHGRPPVEFRAWRTPTQLLIEVADHGQGLTDPYPDLRPPKDAPQYGGYGLWIVGQLAHWVDVVREGDCTVVRAAFCV